ncbi:MAG: alpha-hydroxy acid oxidase [Pseudomonadota bacterium]
MELDLSYPAISDLRARARRRVPHFAFEYLDSATGTEAGQRHNRDGLDAVRFLPAILRGEIAPDCSARFMDRDYALPVAMAPIGMAGSVWPGAEKILARAAKRLNIPFCQSTVAAARPEDTGKLAGDMGWFQHYPVRDAEIRADMLRRIKDAGFHTLVVTVDVPGESRRERQRRALLKMPPELKPKMLWQMATNPAWSMAMAQAGAPSMGFCEDYVPGNGKHAFAHAGRLIRGFPDRDDLEALRAAWQGPMIVKGVLDPEDAAWLKSVGADALWVSTHAGRQFEAGPAAITQLPLIREAVGPDLPLIFDSGIEGGLDILRALALGADFVALGRAFLYAVAAFGPRGVDHLVHILRADMAANMTQLGIERPGDAASRLIRANAV